MSRKGWWVKGSWGLVVVLVLTGIMFSTNAAAVTHRILLVGDSWTQYLWKDRIVRNVLIAKGKSQYDELGANTAVSGSTAQVWAANTYWNGMGLLDWITYELAVNPTVDIVYMSISGNDMLAGQSNGGWYQGIDPSVWASRRATILSALQTVINHCLNQRANVKVVVVDYDYLNLWDTLLQDPLDVLMWQNVGSPTPRQINDAFIDMGSGKLALTQGNSRLAYVQNFGLMQNWKNSPAGAPKPGTIQNGYVPFPGGYRDYPTPMGALAGTSSNRDAIHLSASGFTQLVTNVYNQVLAYWL